MGELFGVNIEHERNFILMDLVFDVRGHGGIWLSFDVFLEDC